MHTVGSLQAFEADIAAEFNAGHIRAPVHLAGGNEDALIEIFKDIRPQDWVITTWRSHYHCLLKDVPAAQLKIAILEGRSITLCYPSYRVLSSAIVGGGLPIALGIAWSIKRNKEDAKVWAFLGDMAATTGIFHECKSYAEGHELPVVWVVEDNGISVCTPTAEVWGREGSLLNKWHAGGYSYELPWPHSGAGKRVNF